MPYTATLLDCNEKVERDHVLTLNPRGLTSATISTSDPSIIQHFHSTLPAYAVTPLHRLPSLAAELGIFELFVKDESTRLGVTSFKILGASWAIHRALCERLGLDASMTEYTTVRDELRRQAGEEGRQLEVVTCTEGNWGRACGRYGALVGVKITVYVPKYVSEYMRNLIAGEGARLEYLNDGVFDDTVTAAIARAKESADSILLIDTSYDGYETVPQWVTDGYRTMLAETDTQIAAALGADRKANTYFAAAGAGSWANSVVTHYCTPSLPSYQPNAKVICVEPTAAACIRESLHRGERTAVKIEPTIMAGMCGGIPSMIAWPSLRDGLSGAVVVEELECHRSVEALKECGINAGPCGAATLAALRRWLGTLSDVEREEAVVVLFSTEGSRDYKVPMA